MGWFWNSAPSGDAYDSLDSRTKDLLNSEAPPAQLPSAPSPGPSTTTSASPPKTYRERLGLNDPSQPPTSTPASPQTPATTQSAPSAPPQSLYPDGRYAHLWATYRPPSDASTGTASQDQLTNILSSYSTRRAEVSRAALENCVEEHIAENECFASGTLMKKMKGCREESTTFSRCYTLQARFLKAMGYMDLEIDRDGRGEERREGMRARADEIWGEVRRREKAEKEGRGREEGPLRVGWVEVEGGEEERVEKLLSWFKEDKRNEIREQIRKLRPSQRELELELRIAEAKADAGYGVEVGKYFEQEREDRRARQKKGQSTLGDWLKWMGGWSQ
ncbi:Cytokinesis protein sepA [Sphaceloma murrayae]|uniref:Cytokinesis protein sepA n=1 Tax=Sphaceloma murrayae TaxID=2082308 RepID=A0A2K1R3I4_9PEZI|nr:Cytokinesis protein sepA [Sphaceloma murrayae]